jgi:signal transduction histidine kinase
MAAAPDMTLPQGENVPADEAFLAPRNRRLQLHDLLETQARRMAQSLHDEAGQLLAVIYLKLDELTESVPVDQSGSIGDLRSKVSELETELRRISHELRPLILDDFGLLPAVEFLRQGVSARTGIAISVEGTVRGRMAPRIETALYRIVHESLRMASQSGSRRVRIAFLRERSRVECSIWQQGGDSEIREGAMTAIRERVEDLSGTMLRCTTPNGNVMMVVGIPVE